MIRRKQSIEINSQLTQMLDFINKDIKICITAVFHMFRKLLSENIKYIKEIRYDFLEMKTVITR